MADGTGDYAAAFEVLNPKTGQRWMIYPDGQIEGFGECVCVINRIPLIERRAALVALESVNG